MWHFSLWSSLWKIQRIPLTVRPSLLEELIQTKALHYISPFFVSCALTVLLGANEDLLTAHPVPCPCEGQHLDTVVGVLLQAVQLQGGLCGCDVPDLSKLWGRENKTKRITICTLCGVSPVSQCHNAMGNVWAWITKAPTANWRFPADSQLGRGALLKQSMGLVLYCWVVLVRHGSPPHSSVRKPSSRHTPSSWDWGPGYGFIRFNCDMSWEWSSSEANAWKA